MQVFLPYPDLRASVSCLDPKRLGNQVYREAKTLISGGCTTTPKAYKLILGSLLHRFDNIRMCYVVFSHYRRPFGRILSTIAPPTVITRASATFPPIRCRIS